MESEQKLETGIFVEEVYHYDVDLGTIPIVSWRSASGSIRVQIPYDGALLKEISPVDDEFLLGTLDVFHSDRNETREPLVVKMPASPDDLPSLFKSPKRSVTRAEYSIEKPSDTLFTIDGEVIDVDDKLSSLVEGNFDAFRNALKLIISLWVPDLWAKAEEDETLELEKMLLQRQDTRQIFLLYANQTELQEELAKSLTALANTEGGVIFIGINEQREVIGLPRRKVRNKHIERCLLQAALRCDPPVHFMRPHYIEREKGKRVAYVKIPASVAAKHKLDGIVYYRHAGKITSDKIHTFSILPSNLVNSIRQAENILDLGIGKKFHPQDDVEIDLRGKSRLHNVKIADHICGLINANQHDTRIVLRNLAPPPEHPWRLQSFRYRQDIRQRIQEYLEEELQKVLPKLPMPNVELAEIDDELIAIIHPPKAKMPVALYNGAAYRWHEEEEELQTVDFEEIFEQYLDAPPIWFAFKNTQQPVYLHHAKFGWPIQPPASDEQTDSTRSGKGVYNIQHRAFTWDSTPFPNREEETEGYPHKLRLPLRQVLLELEEDGSVVTSSPDINGEVVIRLHDVLPSGLSVEPSYDNHSSEAQRTASNLLNNLPIIKQTDLRLNLHIRLKELFERRTKTSVLNFRVLDVDLTDQRKKDLLHVCADLGFRATLASNNSSQEEIALIYGTRSKGFYDISLALGAKCKKIPLKRELRFEEKRIDSRDTSTAILDIHIALQGTGPNVAEEIAQLQMKLYEIVNKRFHHLRTE